MMMMKKKFTYIVPILQKFVKWNIHRKGTPPQESG